MKLGELGEFGLIERLKAFEGRGLVAAIGEDAAVFDLRGGRFLLTTDLMVEGVHFRRDYTPPEALGRKALAVNLSDLAACGAEPLLYTVSLVVSPEEEWSFVEGLYRGMASEGSRWGAELAGGDISRGEGLTLCVALLGRAPEGRVALRGGARPGDLIYLSGRPGEAALGLKLLEAGLTEGGFVRRHLSPEPRLPLGRELVRRGLVTAMIDVSDGLLQDLRHLLSASGCGAEVDLDLLPLSEEFAEAARGMGLDPLELALSGGEDYELLFCVGPERRRDVESLGGELGLELTAIGEVTERGIGLKRGGRPFEPPPTWGFDHLR